MHDRLIPFDRILNFRDFGGWDAVDGAKVVRGKLFRSASFHDATDADIEKLNAMGLRFLVDLRRAEERAHEPSRWANENCRVIFNEDGGQGHALPPHLVALLQSDLSPTATRAYMTNLYREIPYDPRLIRLYRDWFAEIGEGGAGVVHCAAGKDRTGIACALTLLSLGVDEETVFADYEFTNQAVDLEKRMPRIQARMEERLARKLDPEALRPMLGVELGYLHAAMDEIRARSGSVGAYLTDVLGVDEGKRATLRANLTSQS
jgi:protein-tyrosine phosphatase